MIHLCIAALLSFITFADAYPSFLLSCSWIDNSVPGAPFNRMDVTNIETGTSGCSISWDGEGDTFIPCKTYTVTVTSPESYGHAVSVSSGSIGASPDFESYEVKPGCRAQQKQKVSKYTIVAPGMGTMVISALCGQYDIMWSAPKITAKAVSGTGVCVIPTAQTTNFPTRRPTKPTRSPTDFRCSNFTSRKACRKFKVCFWDAAEGVCASSS